MSAAVLVRPVWRVVWKDYRALRGLWVGVAAIALLVDAACAAMGAPSIDYPAACVWVAFGAAALYAAGAASVLFTLEHEEQTYGFLRALPATWEPLFVGKVLVAIVSAVGLAGVLWLAGLVTGGFRTPAGEEVWAAVGVFGVAIFEAAAWGTLCSLVFRRPMVAAVATLVATGVVVHLSVIAANSDEMATTNVAAYLKAAPLRLAIVAVVFACSTVLGRRWFVPKTRASVEWRRALLWRFMAKVFGRWQREKMREAAAAGERRADRGAMLVRLLWQTWREGWKLLPLPIVVWGGCVAAVVFFEAIRPATGSEPSEVMAVISMFFAPALFGTLVFAADQRRGQLRFFAEHAARPRYVWFSRHVVWFGAFTVFAAVVCALAVKLVLLMWSDRADLYRGGENFNYFEPNIRRELQAFLAGVSPVTTLAVGGSLLAYAIGQFCSMLLRSEILAAFLTLVLAVVLSAWVVALNAWLLSGWLFLMPLAMALLLATWLRAPAWIAGRNSWRAWWRPVVLVIGAVSLVGVLLPVVRLAQVSREFRWVAPEGMTAAMVSEPSQAARAEAEQTAEMYLRAASLLNDRLDDTGLAKWRRPGLIEDGPVGVDEGTADSISGVHEDRIPTNELGEYRTAKAEFIELWNKHNAEVYKLAIEASERPTCKFPFTISRREDAGRRSTTGMLVPGPSYELVSNLLQLLTYTPAKVNGEVTFEQLKAALRMNEHVRAGQPTAIVIWQLQMERQILAQIVKWAAGKERTDEERRAAIEGVQKLALAPPDLRDALLADARDVRAVVLGQEPSFLMQSEPLLLRDRAAFAANELPWERRRAIAALDMITDFNIRQADEVLNSLRQNRPAGPFGSAGRRLLLPEQVPANWQMELVPAITSYFMSAEYRLRVPVNELFLAYCDAVAVRWATYLQLGLVAYRADQGEYPEKLSQLVPKYLVKELHDPYGGQPFVYWPKGLDAELGGMIGHNNFIPEHTPLLWSVGPENLQLQAREYYVPSADDGDRAEAGPDSSSDESAVPSEKQPSSGTRRRSFALLPSDPYKDWFYASPPLVFVLPK